MLKNSLDFVADMQIYEIMNKATFLLFLFLLSACGPVWHLKRSERHKLKALQLGAVIKTDTVFTEKTIITKEVKKDTVFKDVAGDTVYINKDNIKIKYVRIPGDSVFIAVKAEQDTIRIEVPVTVTEVVHAEKPWMNRWWIWLLVGFAIGIILCLSLKR